jgi:hypothetical protein
MEIILIKLSAPLFSFLTAGGSIHTLFFSDAIVRLADDGFDCNNPGA